MKKLLLCSLVFAGMMGLILPGALASEEPGKNVHDDGILTMGEISANPQSFKATPVMFRGQFHMFNELYSPFYTIFNAASHLNFSAWEYEAPLWHKEAYKHDYPYLYVDKKDRRLSEVMLELKPYTRFEAVGEVRSTFNNIAWIQITDLKVLPKSLDPESIKHMARGYYQKKKGDNLNAALEFNQAYQETLPQSVRWLIRWEEGQALYALGKYWDAEHALEAAVDQSTSKFEKTKAENLLKESLAMQEYEEMLEDKMEEWAEEVAEREEEEAEAARERAEEEAEAARERAEAEAEAREAEWEEYEETSEEKVWEEVK